jgi:hypothetical protein
VAKDLTGARCSARAESVDQHVTESADAVICNSAIWQTDFAATAMAVRAMTKAGGRFAFNVPVGFLDDGDSQGESELESHALVATARLPCRASDFKVPRSAPDSIEGLWELGDQFMTIDLGAILNNPATG